MFGHTTYTHDALKIGTVCKCGEPVEQWTKGCKCIYIKSLVNETLSLLFLPNSTVVYYTKQCQEASHIQQVAYSTYHSALTQICFFCRMVRTSIKEETF